MSGCLETRTLWMDDCETGSRVRWLVHVMGSGQGVFLEVSVAVGGSLTRARMSPSDVGRLLDVLGGVQSKVMHEIGPCDEGGR